MTLKKSVENSAYDMLIELVNMYHAFYVLNELFSSLDTDSEVDFITGFIRYWDTPKNIFDTEDLQAVEEARALGSLATRRNEAKEIALKKCVEDSAYDMLIELVNMYHAYDVLNELFSSLNTDSEVDFITSFIRYWDTPKNIFDKEDLQAVEEYAKIHC